MQEENRQEKEKERLKSLNQILKSLSDKEDQARQLVSVLKESVKDEITAKLYKSIPQYLVIFSSNEIKERDPDAP